MNLATWAGAAALATVAGAPFAIEARRRPVAADRDQAPGSLVALSDGITHCRRRGPPGGPVTVCVHGLTTPAYVWDRLAEGLAAQGRRVLVYDLYGRGYSDRPRGAQTRGFFLRQLRELLDHEGVDAGFELIGYSMGGSIATAFAAEEPERPRRLVLVAPAGLVHAPGALAEAARRLPGPGDWLMLVFGGVQLRRAAGAIDPVLAQRQTAEIERRGYLPAVLSSQRHLLAETLDAEHARIREAGLEVLAIWGAEDTVIPLAARDRLAEANPDARHAVIPGAGHGLVVTHAEAVLAAIAGRA